MNSDDNFSEQWNIDWSLFYPSIQAVIEITFPDKHPLIWDDCYLPQEQVAPLVEKAQKLKGVEQWYKGLSPYSINCFLTYCLLMVETEMSRRASWPQRCSLPSQVVCLAWEHQGLALGQTMRDCCAFLLFYFLLFRVWFCF